MLRKKRFWLVLILAIVLIPIGWWLGSPLFLDQVVDEEIPVASILPSVDGNSETGAEQAKEQQNEQANDQSANQDILETIDTADVDAEMAIADVTPTVFEGAFRDGERSYETSGIVYSIQTEEQQFLRFEDFKTTNGPDLFVYLVDGNQSVGDGINLGELRGNIGNQNYEIPVDFELTESLRVVIYCKAFNRVFGEAGLTVRN